MSAAHADTFLRAIFESIDLGAFDMVHHRNLDKDVAHSGRSDQDIVAVCHEQDAFDVEFITRFHGKAIHFDGAPFDGTVLLATAFNNCESHFSFLQSFTSPCACGYSLKPSPANGEAGGSMSFDKQAPQPNQL